MTIAEPHTPPSLPTPTYHQELRAHVEATEPELWAWFSETVDPTIAETAETELDLLKTTYRLDGEVNSVLTADAVLISDMLGIEQQVVLYQELNDSNRNARVLILGDKVHVVFSGDILNLLSPAEQRAVLAHELGHVALLVTDGGAYQVLHNLVNRLADSPTAPDAIEETARRLRLHTEVYADALSSYCCDLNDLVTAVVKTSAGLRNVDAGAYIRQAEEVLAADAGQAVNQSHPELHIRVACMVANAAGGDRPLNPQLVERLINGSDDLDRIDLLGQVRLQELSRKVLAGASRCVGVSDALSSFMLNFDTDTKSDRSTETINDGELAEAHPSVRFYAGSLLVDAAFVADAATNDLPILRALSAEASRIGAEAEFDRIFAKATEQNLSDIRRLRKAAE